MTRLLVITPVRNEATHLGRVVESVIAQRRRPDRWLIVDDGSTDASREVAARHAAGHPWIEVLRAPQVKAPDGDRLAVAAEALAFNWALGQTRDDWDLVAKLDGDMLLTPDHFERVLAVLEDDPRLGIAGTYMDEIIGGRRIVSPMPEYHVNGALKVYRRECFEAIGGVPGCLGWDTIDQVQARMAGWRTQSLREPRPLHLRPSGSAQGQLRGRARHGECVWLLHFPVPIVLARTLRLLGTPPLVLSGLAYGGGYLRAALRRRPRVADPAFRAFVRREQYARLRGALRLQRRR